MFQQTIQDVLALAEAGPRPEDLLDRVCSRIRAFESFECGEILAETERGLLRFVVAPGLLDMGAKVLTALGDEATLRVDTAAEVKECFLSAGPGLASLLILRISAPGAASAAIVLGHSRAWSFAAAPLSRIRTIASLALRLLIRSSLPSPPPPETMKLTSEVARLRAHVSGLEDEIVALRAERAARKDSDRPR